MVKTDPFKDKGKARTELVKTEIEDKDNDNLSAVKTINRLGVTTFVVIFNIAITIFVFMLVAIMIFSQVLFIIYAVFLPISCLLAMIPSFNNLMKTTIMRLFNTIMMRAGITLVLTMAFCLSTMIYGLSATTPFFLVAFLQIVTFGGIWFKLGDLMGMMQLHSSDSQNGANRIVRRSHRMIRQLVGNAALGNAIGRGLKRSNPDANDAKRPTKQGHKPPDKRQQKKPALEKAGRKVGDLIDTKRKLKHMAQRSKDNLKDLPINTRYGFHQSKEAAKNGTKKRVDDFKQGVKNQRQENQHDRELAAQKRREQMKDRKLALEPRPSPDTKPNDRQPSKSLKNDSLHLPLDNKFPSTKNPSFVTNKLTSTPINKPLELTRRPLDKRSQPTPRKPKSRGTD